MLVSCNIHAQRAVSAHLRWAMAMVLRPIVDGPVGPCRETLPALDPADLSCAVQKGTDPVVQCVALIAQKVFHIHEGMNHIIKMKMLIGHSESG